MNHKHDSRTVSYFQITSPVVLSRIPQMSLSLGIFLDLEGDLWLTSWPSVLMKISEERFDCLLAWLWLDLGRKLSSAVVAQGDWRPYQGSANCPVLVLAVHGILNFDPEKCLKEFRVTCLSHAANATLVHFISLRNGPKLLIGTVLKGTKNFGPKLQFDRWLKIRVSNCNFGPLFNCLNQQLWSISETNLWWHVKLQLWSTSKLFKS